MSELPKLPATMKLENADTNPDERIPVTGSLGRLTLATLARPVWLAMGALVLLTAIMHFSSYEDYVGVDNDDVMRLVMVRDLLGGQGWFDMVQHRLGLEGGTHMHWSRLIDLPIAALIGFFSLFFHQTMAEAIALFIWPLVTAAPVFFALSYGAGTLAGLPSGARSGNPDNQQMPASVMPAAMIGLLMAVVFVLSSLRFQPGGIDHHNAQLAVITVIAAALLQPSRSTRSYGLAGFAAAIAIAIGVETMPHIAIVCVIVALFWAWHGESMRRAAGAFALAMAVTLTLVFVATIHPSNYRTVTCDSLSVGFYSLGTFGATSLFLATALISHGTFRSRLFALAAIGVATSFLAVLVAPQCLGNPLSNLDPLLVEIWLNTVIETQPIWSSFHREPWTSGNYYAAPLVAMALCVHRIVKGDRVQAHFVLLALILVSYAISLVQIRGAIFSNILSIIPLAVWTAELRARSNTNPKHVKAGLAFFGAALVSIPSVWGLSGMALQKGYNLASSPEQGITTANTDASCKDAKALETLAAQPTGVVVASSNLGASILRFTAHRALSAPYHRNQGGMLLQIRAGMAEPEESIDYLRAANVDYIAFCPSDDGVATLVSYAPNGLYAKLKSGQIPDFLELIAGTEDQPIKLFRVRD